MRSSRSSTAHRGGVQLERGTLYPVLHRLEGKGFLVTEWLAGENGKKRRYYKLTSAARARRRRRRRNGNFQQVGERGALRAGGLSILLVVALSGVFFPGLVGYFFFYIYIYFGLLSASDAKNSSRFDQGPFEDRF